MRPLRFMFLVACFIAIPILLTCISLLRTPAGGAEVFGNPSRSRLRALFSFSTPSTLFPPTALISLAAENSTFFLARPAAFGPSLPSKGLTGQLWVGRGFGDDRLLSEDDLKISGFELGCSDVPGWGDEQKTPDNPAQKKSGRTPKPDDRQTDSQISSEFNSAEGIDAEGIPLADEEDGTDDHLHRPLPDSNPAPVVRKGEAADVKRALRVQQKPTHADIESLQESADIAGKVVMLSRGGCGFLEKVKWAQRRGGIALIVGDNERNGPLTIMYAKGDTSNITIPAIFTSYTSAHLLSTLVPPESEIVTSIDGKKPKHSFENAVDSTKARHDVVKEDGPVFTTSPTSTSAHSTKTNPVLQNGGQGWMQHVMQVVGLDEDATAHGEDSRRPPGSGNIEWVQVKDWDEELYKTTSTGTFSTSLSRSTSATSKTFKHQTTSKAGNDDFVIGVQDWRDTELIAPKSTATTLPKTGKTETASTQTAIAEGQFKGGSIIPGSGEYQKLDKSEKLHQPDSLKDHVASDGKHSFPRKIKSWFKESDEASDEAQDSEKKPDSSHKHRGGHHDDDDDDARDGLWVTLTPASVSTSPFFDTLLVLVVSPLVTLTFVYGLLLLRSRIRRRRWRAPKSVVEQLPTRIYHPMSSNASTSSSSQISSPDRSQAGSPQPSADVVRVRQRSQTTAGVVSASSTSPPKMSATEEKWRRSYPKPYRGRQIECVVCLEEYVDGESLVMSLPCGHEFHADCITPWLVNRRRTCPICKSDVVRDTIKHQRIQESWDLLERGEETADSVQEPAATSVPDDGSTASIPIPERMDLPNIMDEDVERGDADVAPSSSRSAPEGDHEQQRPIAARWRGIINSSLSNLSGDTLWRANSVDRNR